MESQSQRRERRALHRRGDGGIGSLVTNNRGTDQMEARLLKEKRVKILKKRKLE